MNWKLLSVFWLAGALVLGRESQGSRARPQVFTGPFTGSTATPQDPGEVTIPAYSGSAPLHSVRLTVRHHISWRVRFENLDGFVWWGQNGWGYPTVYSYPWFHNEQGGVTMFGLPSWSILQCSLPTLGEYDGVLDYAGMSGVTSTVLWNYCAQPDYWTTTTYTITEPYALAPFRDPDGVASFSIRPMAWVQEDVGVMVPTTGSLASRLDWFAWDIVVDRVEYNGQ
jgi:hypothetical protein